jgi:F-type H+-transporting ATPase subunit epsilon
VEQQFLTLDKQEQSVRSVLTRMESDVIRRLVEVHHD